MFEDLWELYEFRFFVIYGIPLILLFTGTYIYSYFFGPQKIKRIFKNLSITSIRECKDKEISKINGKLVFSNENHNTPFSQRECSLYELTFEEEYTPHSQRDNLFAKNSWREISSRTAKYDFLIFDGSDYAVIQTDSIVTLLHRELMLEKVSGSSFEDGIEISLKKLMRGLGISPSDYVHYDSGIRIYEAILEKGESVSICGSGEWVKTTNISSLNGLNIDLPDKMFVFQGSKQSPLYISDNKEVIGA